MEASGEGQRRQLERPPLGGGEQYAHEIEFPKGAPPSSPWWDLPRLGERLLPEIAEIRARSAALSDAQLGRDRRVIIEAETLPNFLAASHYPGDFFAATGLLPVGSRTSTGTRLQPQREDVPDQPAKTFLLSANAEALTKLEAVYRDPAQVEGPLREDALKFTGFSLEGPEEVLRMGTGEVPEVVEDRYPFEAVLHPQLVAQGEVDPAASLRVRDEFIAYLDSLGGSVNTDFARFEANQWYLPVRVPRDPDLLRSLASFTQVRVLRPSPAFRAVTTRGDDTDRQPPLLDATPAAGRRIAIFDGGVDAPALGLDRWVTEHDLTDRPRASAHHEHGTAVTSACIFGDLGSDAVAPHTGVDHFRIWPMPAGVDLDVELPWVLQQIEAIVALGHHKIFVITLAPSLNIEDADPHLWTVTLDRLAVEHDVLFVVAAGNTGELEADLDRILVPADLINGLSVGSCTGSTGLPIRDAYSSVGPGRAGGRTAPTGMQFGGNLDSNPFLALAADGAVGVFEGTSYAAPVVARGCAELDALLDGEAPANLLRTLAVHRAERPLKKNAETEGSMPRDVGYGRLPASYAEGFEHRPNEVTIVYDGMVKRRPMVAVEIPIPDDVYEEAPTRTFAVRWTLGFFAPVEPSNPVDYASAGIRVVFRPHRARFTFTNEEGRKFERVNVEKEAALVQTLETTYKAVQAQYPESTEQSGVATEVVQRQYHGKWEGVVRMDRGMKGASLLAPRLDFHMLTREGGDLQREAERLGYVLIVSVTAPEGVELYDRTLVYADLLTPLQATVPVLVGAGGSE